MTRLVYSVQPHAEAIISQQTGELAVLPALLPVSHLLICDMCSFWQRRAADAHKTGLITRHVGGWRWRVEARRARSSVSSSCTYSVRMYHNVGM